MRSLFLIFLYFFLLASSRRIYPAYLVEAEEWIPNQYAIIEVWAKRNRSAGSGSASCKAFQKAKGNLITFARRRVWVGTLMNAFYPKMWYLIGLQTIKSLSDNSYCSFLHLIYGDFGNIGIVARLRAWNTGKSGFDSRQARTILSFPQSSDPFWDPSGLQPCVHQGLSKAAGTLTWPLPSI